MTCGTRRHPAAPGCPLSRSQLDVLAAVAGGAGVPVIARDLQLTPAGVQARLTAAYRALGLEPTGDNYVTRALAVAAARPWLTLAGDRGDPDPPLSPVHLAYAHCFVRLCRERTPAAQALVTAAYVCLAGETGLRRRERSQPDVDELLLRMARGLTRPI